MLKQIAIIATALLAISLVGVSFATTIAPGATQSGSGPVIISSTSPSGSMTLEVSHNTTFIIQMEKQKLIGAAFSVFNVTMTITGVNSNYNHVFYVTTNHSDRKVTLEKGTYTITVLVKFTPRSTTSSVEINDVPFLFLHPTGQDHFLSSLENVIDHGNRIIVAELSYS
ncbi:MAG: hypothetical protein M1315_01885 [Candidatus Thermoplasmatota archaeon]|nr:hypothetical protein [Candidatus Thermoplasmatota archaeon]